MQKAIQPEKQKKESLCLILDVIMFHIRKQLMSWSSQISLEVPMLEWFYI